MSIIDDIRPSQLAARTHRRYEIVVAGGLRGALHAAEALSECGLPVRDFAVDVREGITYSSVSCTVSMTSDEARYFTDRLAGLPSVVAVDPA